MLEKLLKELGEQGYTVEWRYELPTNSIIIRLIKIFPGEGWRRYQLCQKVGFDEFYYGVCSQSMFEFNMVQILRQMVKKIEHDAGKHDGYYAKPFPDESEALRSPTDGSLPSSDHY